MCSRLLTDTVRFNTGVVVSNTGVVVSNTGVVVSNTDVRFNTVMSLSLVRWRYLRCCDFDDFSPSFPIGRQL